MTMTEGFGRRAFLGGLGAAALALPAGLRAQAPRRQRDLLIVNALGGFGNPNGESDDMLSPRVLADARASGMNVVNQTLGYVAGEMDPFDYTVQDIATWNVRLRDHPADVLQVLTAADLLRAKRERKIGVIYGFQNSVMIGTNLERVATFAGLGVRVIQLTYNPANRAGDGSMSPENRGLTPFGRELVAALNASRLMVDLSHSGERTCLEAARLSRQPISINHTGCRALCDLPRNKTDAELRLVAERGGFVGIYFMPFLSPDSVAEPADVVAHLEHAVNICGEDHVGIGTDGGTTGVDDMAAYRARIRAEIAQRRAMGIGARGENPDTLPFVERLSGPGQFHDLIRLLEARRWPARRIEKVMGLNFLGYAREIWG
ncbi:dipeptidase [Allosphingosinicella sp.]|uniref:dipeptidase n=1 Tax=Allosphingosinicella sp. TaxID=2823234 RepID=UPI00378400DF